jgi:hypothetical protein
MQSTKGIYPMKTVTKLLMGAAVMAGSAGAAHAGATLPSTDNSQLMFFVNDLTTHSTYTAELTQTINGAGGYFTTGDAQTPGAVLGAVNTINGDGPFSYSFASDTALQSFISTAEGAGNTLQWGLIAGAYSGPTQVSREPTGNTLFLTTAAGSPIGSVSESALTNGAPTSYNTDIGRFNLNSLDANNGTLNGIFGTSSSSNGTNLNLYGVGFNQSGLAIGATAYTVYGETSTGSGGGQALSFALGTAYFNGTTLSFTGNQGSPVPLPAAAWLFGSGLLGLLGIGRRRDGVATAA